MNSTFNSRRWTLGAPCLVFSILLTACGGGSSDDGNTGGGGGGGDKPQASIEFPPTDGLSFAEKLTVRGTADDDGDVQAVTVNGVAATSSDGFATWTAEVTLKAGANEFVVSVVDTDGETTTEAASVTVTRTPQPMMGLTGIKVDEANNRAIVLDGAQRALFAVDLDSGVHTILSSPVVGSGPNFTAALNLDIDPAGEFAWVYDYLSSTLFQINLSSGQRSIVASPAKGTGTLPGVNTGPSPGIVRDVAVDTFGGKSYLIDYEAIYEVDHATGNRAVLAEFSTSGIYALWGIEWDAANNRLVAVDYGSSDIYYIDPLSGAVTAHGGFSGASFGGYDLALDSTGTQAWVIGLDDDVHKLDIVNGTATTLAGPAAGIGAPNALDGFDGGDVFVANLEGQVIAIRADASHEVISAADHAHIGTGPVLGYSDVVAFDLETNRVYVYDTTNLRFLSVNLETGARTEVTVESVPHRIVMDRQNQRLLGMSGNSVYEVDRQTGKLALLGTVVDVPPERVSALEIDHTVNSILFASFDRIAKGSLSDFTGEIIAFGSLDNLGSSADLLHDPQRDRVLSINSNNALFTTQTGSTAVTQLKSGFDLRAEGVHLASALELDESGNNAYLLDGRGDSVFRMNLDTLVIKPVAGVAAGSSGSFGMTSAMGVDEGRGLAWLYGRDSVIVVDLVGGDSVIISR